MENTEKSRKEIAIELFKQGYGCCQAVLLTFSDVCEMDKDMAIRIASSFGGGMGRMREVCGTVSGMGMVIGMMTGSTNPRDIQAKKHTYDMVQELAGEFRKRNGSIICKELLGLTGKSEQFQDTMPEERTEQYYKKRPCAELVGCAAEILEKYLLEKEKL